MGSLCLPYGQNQQNERTTYTHNKLKAIIEIM
jgi:hypothetical protein